MSMCGAFCYTCCYYKQAGARQCDGCVGDDGGGMHCVCVQGYVCTPLCTVRCIENHDGNFVCRLALFAVIAPLTVNIFDYLLAFNR